MDSALLKSHLTEDAKNLFSSVHVHDEIDSTNSEVVRLLESMEQSVNLVVADSQSAGRGRRGRNWQSHAGSGIYMSLSFPVEKESMQLQALSLVTALSVQQSLSQMGFDGIQLKWPNDLLVNKKKLAGILLEMNKGSGQTAGIDHVIFGIGINYALSDEQKAAIGRPVIGLSDLNSTQPSRERIAATVSSELLSMIQQFFITGFAPFRSAWNALDRYFESDIVIDNGKQRLIGKSLGVNEEGVLQIVTADGQQSISAGEIFPSLRAAEEAVDL